MKPEDMRIVEKKINYEFKEKSLLQQAFVRKSYAVEHGCVDNEVLEFIGDKVLDLVVIQLLVEEHCSMTMEWKYRQQAMLQKKRIMNEPNVLHSNKTEGELTEIKKALVQRKNLARRIDELGFINYITMSQSDIDNRVYENASVKEDLFEAILGAIAIDCKWDMKDLKRVVDQMLQPDLSEGDTNYVSELQEWSQKKYNVLPSYDIKEFTLDYINNPNYIYDCTSHRRIDCNPGYIAYLSIPGIAQTILGFGSTQSEARKDAARYALKVLEERDLLFSMKDEIDEPSRDLAINQLEILSSRGYFLRPEYDFEESYDEDGHSIWHCVAYIPETQAMCSAESSVKKEAKKDAAYKLLIYLLED
ncbi:ribonuclease-3 [Lachnospiraceae bacterium XBD2001]|nr:ribonuclease-3 [Lachnospiraceae bacterium XBD2001]